MCSRHHVDGDAARIDQIDRSVLRWSRAAAVSACRSPSASRSRSASSCALNAAPTKRERGPRRRITHGGPASVPRSCRLVGGAQHGRESERWANASARARSGFSNSSQAMSCTLITGLRDRPGCSPLRPPCSLCRSLWAADHVVHVSPLLTDEIVTYDGSISQSFLTKSSKLMSLCYRGRREPNSRTSR